MKSAGAIALDRKSSSVSLYMMDADHQEFHVLLSVSPKIDDYAKVTGYSFTGTVVVVLVNLSNIN